jgi:predicted RNase H-like nuclease (RuvC/YqgF family)
MKHLRWIFPVLLLLSGCGGSDIALLNEVKRFEPEWLDLSETVSYIDRNLRIAGPKYKDHFRELDRHLAADGGSLRSEFRTLMKDQEQIQADFSELKGRFLEQLQAFNKWENKLSQGKIDEGLAKGDFIIMKREYQQLSQDAQKLYKRLNQNVEQHNALAKRIGVQANLYTNFDISLR